MLKIFFQQLHEDWPKLVASGLLLPAVQFLVKWVLQFRRDARIARLRQQLIEIDKFIDQYQDRRDVAKVARALSDAEAEREQLLGRLEAARIPTTVSSPALKRIGRAMLLYSPTYSIGWLFRGLFLVYLVLEVWAAFKVGQILLGTAPYDNPDVRLTWGLETFFFLLGAVYLNAVARAVDRIKGRVVKRALWRRAFLFFRPTGWVAVLSTVLFYLIWVSFVGTLLSLAESGDLQDMEWTDWIALLIVPAFGALYWAITTHLDRDGVERSAQTQQVSAAIA